jgi:phosphomannomutase
VPLTTSEIIASSNIAFGTSGARGLVSDFSEEVCGAFTLNFVKAMQQNFNFSRVAIGIDNRPSSPQMAAACIGVLHAINIETDFFGVLPTPALAYQAIQVGVPAIMITGSHIPFDRNGIKFYRPDGEVSKADEAAILAVNGQLPQFTSILPDASTKALDAYIDRYLSVLPSDLLVGKHIGIYEHSSAGRDIYYQVFSALGAKVTRLERSDSFVPIDTEAVSDVDRKKGLNWSFEFGFDAIFSTDGDGDRPLIADENGTWLRGDIVGLLCAKALGIDSLAVPVSCNTAIEQSGIFQKVVRTKIGSPHVIAAIADLIRTNIYVAGFEANGGFLLGSDVSFSGKILKGLPTRDALLPALALLALAGNQGLSKLLASLPQRYTASDRLQQIPNEWSNTFLSNAATSPEKLLIQLGLGSRQIKCKDQTDGLRIEFVDGDIVHLRQSGNAPELRCYTETHDEFTAQALVQTILGAINELMK